MLCSRLDFMQDANADTSSALVVFTLAEQKCALQISAIERVVRAVTIAALPEAPDGVLGVVNVQGNILPVFDLRARFGFPKRGVLLDDQFIIARSRDRLVALVADEVLGVIQTGESAVVQSAEILPGLTGIHGAVRLNGEVVFIYNLDHFLSTEEEEKLTRAIAPHHDQSRDSGKAAQ